MDDVLDRLLACHSTPGDEGEVAQVLAAAWREAGWEVVRHGSYAVSACDAAARASRPVLLICSHMDSPGYSVDRPRVAGAGPGKVRFGLTELGSPEIDGGAVPAVIKTRQGAFGGTLLDLGDRQGEPDLAFELKAGEADKAGVRHGDRVCFSPVRRSEGHLLTAPFLDNRLGCWMLARLAAEARAWQTDFRIVLGATGSEEMGGFGARVLAAGVRPDLAVVLDTTYEAPEQGVRLGKGPVLTLSDASVLLSPEMRDRVLGLMERASVPVQTEVYNFSGTDAKAFPQAGLGCPVLPVLVPTRGNHSPREEADARDFEPWLAALRAVAEGFEIGW